MRMKKCFLKLFSAAAVFILAILIAVPVASAEGCFSIVVGKNASADGYVIMGHNEDDYHPQIVNHHKIPRTKHTPDEKVTLVNGGELNQIEETWAYIWSEMPGMLFSDSYLNEWGVCIASDACPSREDRPELTDGGISYMLRRLVIERAKTAREGVVLAGNLVERFGYDSSGRTYIICDPKEGWLFCAINGKHWMARRVPDNEVAVVANTFSVREVDLTDQKNFLASADIIEYAISRGWYDPDEDGSFDFATVYADPWAAKDSGNFCRQWGGLRHITRDEVSLSQDLPFSVVPKTKLDVAAVMQILRDHYEGTELHHPSPQTESPHKSSPRTICHETTQTSFVAQLRRIKPLDIGIVYWVCMGPPCTSFYIPFHFGITQFPDGFSSNGERPPKSSSKENIEPLFEVTPPKAFSTFWNFHYKVDSTYANTIASVQAEIEKVEKHAFALQKPLEKAARRLYRKNKTTALELLTNYSNGLYLSALEAMNRVSSKK
jgi:dipeptidase